uniref:Ig-like domain-containing protein n=1 Tax=Hippocampus comes TaxID=109280 RepID=A0A3Q2XNM9_HIPCM
MMSQTMSAVLLFMKVLTVYCLSPSQPKVEADCDKNVDLSCLCRDSTHFQLLSWYKIIEQKRHFLISTGDGLVEKATFSQRATFGEGDSLHLPAVKPSDSGTYKCAITANVGGQNKDCVVDLVVHACVTNTPTMTMTNEMLNTIPSAVNTSQKNGEELPLPVVWSSLSYLAVGLAKVLISCIGVRVIQACRM